MGSASQGRLNFAEHGLDGGGEEKPVVKAGFDLASFERQRTRLSLVMESSWAQICLGARMTASARKAASTSDAGCCRS